MKSNRLRLIIPLAGLALGLPSAVFAGLTAASPTPGAASSAPADSSWSARWHKLEDEMDRIFRESTQKLHINNDENESTFGSSIDVRETDDAYVARIYAPKSGNGDVNVTLKDGTLNVSTGTGKSGAYQESIALPGPVQEDKMKVEHKEDMLLVTIPKQKQSGGSTASTGHAPVVDNWDRQILREMQRMQDRMDQLSRDVFAGQPNLPGIMDEQFLSSTVKLDDQKDQYVVHFYVPDSNVSNFKVDLKDNQLRLSASQESKKEANGTNGAGSQYSSSQYEEAIAIPGPVHADKMKVDRKEGVVTVTLPKA